MDTAHLTDPRDALRGLRVVLGDEFVREFDEHRLCRRADGMALAFLTLAVLVARAGHLVEKAELLDAVWANAHVEEGGLARNISLPRYIDVRRHLREQRRARVRRWRHRGCCRGAG